MNTPLRSSGPWQAHRVAAALFAGALLSACGLDDHSGAAPPGATLPAVQMPLGPDPGAGAGQGDTHGLSRNPFEGSQEAREQGRQLFIQMNCYGCHGGHAGGGMGPSLRGPAWIYGSSPGALYSSIAQGRGKGMPAWGLRLPSNVIWWMVLYLQSLGTADEPDPPSPAPPQAPAGIAPDPLVPRA